MKKILVHSYNDIISLDNLLHAWSEFVVGKKKKADVQEFSLHLMDNILALHEELSNRTYRHGDYQSFHITDPKPRHIHKAQVRDRLVHHAVYRILYPFFDSKFIFDSYSCRLNKGTHRAINRLCDFNHTLSRNNTKTVYCLKLDIRKFFANIDHDILLNILREYIPDQKIFWLLANIIDSFRTSPDKAVGLPLGNLTSQLFANVYMNELDQLVEHHLKWRLSKLPMQYIRYADDFVFLSQDKILLEDILSKINYFLERELKLRIHPDKIVLTTVASGVDFLGWVNFPDYRVLRTRTKRRMLARVSDNSTDATIKSYLGMLKHGNAWGLKKEICI